MPNMTNIDNIHVRCSLGMCQAYLRLTSIQISSETVINVDYAEVSSPKRLLKMSIYYLNTATIGFISMIKCDSG